MDWLFKSGIPCSWGDPCTACRSISHQITINHQQPHLLLLIDINCNVSVIKLSIIELSSITNVTNHGYIPKGMTSLLFVTDPNLGLGPGFASPVGLRWVMTPRGTPNNPGPRYKGHVSAQGKPVRIAPGLSNTRAEFLLVIFFDQTCCELKHQISIKSVIDYLLGWSCRGWCLTMVNVTSIIHLHHLCGSTTREY